MRFKEALAAIRGGKKVKLPSWTGYWCCEDDSIKMHCKDGRVLDITESEDIFYTLSNIVSDEWMILDDDYTFEGDPERSYTHNFGAVLAALKNGARAKRKGWNGQDQYIELGEDISYHGLDGRIHANAAHEDIGSKALVFNGSRGIQVGWTPSQSDLLAEDWILITDFTKLNIDR